MAPSPDSGQIINPLVPVDSLTITTKSAEARAVASNVKKHATWTVSRSDSYAEGLASVVARAFVKASDPLTRLFVSEVEQISSANQDLEAAFIVYTHARIARKLADSSETFIAESANFAAATVWEAKSIHEASRVLPVHLQVTARDRWLHELETLQRQTLWPVVAAFDQAQGQTEGTFWHLCLTARDPARDNIAGAVRAVIVPIMKKLVTGEGVEVDGRIVGRTPVLDSETGVRVKTPVWLEASSNHSRDVYRHFGFRDAGIVNAGHAGGDKIPVWAMIYTGEADVI